MRNVAGFDWKAAFYGAAILGVGVALGGGTLATRTDGQLVAGVDVPNCSAACASEIFWVDREFDLGEVVAVSTGPAIVRKVGAISQLRIFDGHPDSGGVEIFRGTSPAPQDFLARNGIYVGNWRDSMPERITAFITYEPFTTCQLSDTNRDGTVDLVDHGTFQNCVDGR